jgi:hypothetical protein
MSVARIIKDDVKNTQQIVCKISSSRRELSEVETFFIPISRKYCMYKHVFKIIIRCARIRQQFSQKILCFMHITEKTILLQ